MIYSSRMDEHGETLKWFWILSLALVTAMLLTRSLGGGATML